MRAAIPGEAEPMHDTVNAGKFPPRKDFLCSNQSGIS